MKQRVNVLVCGMTVCFLLTAFSGFAAIPCQYCEQGEMSCNLSCIDLWGTQQPQLDNCLDHCAEIWNSCFEGCGGSLTQITPPSEETSGF